MPDLDLRRQVLESKKTVSRKARQKQALAGSGASSPVNSAPNSRAGSRNASRAASRNVSEDEAGFLSDETDGSNQSFGFSLSRGSLEEENEVADMDPTEWKSWLSNLISEIIQRKRSTTSGRKRALTEYTNILRTHFAQEQIQYSADELIHALLKSVDTSEEGEDETVIALKAISLTIITDSPAGRYEDVYKAIKEVISDSETSAPRQAAIHALSIVSVFGGASTNAIEETMDWFLEIVSSDGCLIGADDDAGVVRACEQEWGFLATQLDDLEEQSEPAITAFHDQLQSTNAQVKIAAGENIALLYEASYDTLAADEEVNNESERLVDPDRPAGAPKLAKRYQPFRQEHHLKETLSELVNSTTAVARTAKKDRKAVKACFADILNSVEYPNRGPRYSTALSEKTGQSYGSRMSFRIRDSGEIRLDKWWKLFRLEALRRCLQSGLVTHFEENEAVADFII
ncbi:uncharacterized protein K452DRAFT_301116 [Aplosporella prunicola CBS 121167]|uniref:Interferon-related developmental regulator N-terminal domain-containing protein n=1 Tax=Aplosporella prunicola CBS 121167 TaxID=1176127 RepID=A0A6A6B328_9PEZI|nr:uncharacterized protein K452DRAFT_301116 [Aplosporella prunicola CBS 121167]KAF2138589.1 hypothetical protein K452DRAFT_301116 [Aplosporella prunicola CBS 121167]